MWQTIIPVIASIVSKNNPNAAKVINTASQITNMFKKDEKRPTE